MVAHVRGTVVYERGKGTFRQAHPKTDASVRAIPVPEFAAAVIRRRIARVGPGTEERRSSPTGWRAAQPAQLPAHLPGVPGPCRAGGLGDHPALVSPDRGDGARPRPGGGRGGGPLGHTSTAITEGHYIEPDRTVDFGPAAVLESTLRPIDPDGALLQRPESEDEEEILDAIDSVSDDDVA